MTVAAAPALDLEAEYNNRARVPAYPAIAARWAEAAAAYRARAQAGWGLPYGPGERHKCDLYHPPGGMTATTPLVVFIHGGYWQRGERQQYAHLAEPLNKLGIAVAMPSYDLCPAVGVADIIQQMQQCMVMLWQATRRRPVVAGHSAGGHMTAGMLATNWADFPGVPADLVRAGFAISGVFDVRPLVSTSLNEALKLTPESAREVSLHDALPPRSDLTLVAAVGGAESQEFIRQSRDIAAAWARHGLATEFVEVDGADHFTVLDPLADAASPMVARLADLARRFSVA